MSRYLISGELRRQKKKELSNLRTYVEFFWFNEQIERVYGGGLDDRICHKLISEASEKIKQLELDISKPSIDIQRYNKLNELGI